MQEKPVVKPSVSADKVVTAFLQAKSTGTLASVKPYLCKSSIEFLDNALNTPQAKSAGFTRQEVHKMYLWDVEPSKDKLQGATITTTIIEDKEAKENTARVRATVAPQSSEFGPLSMDFDYILVIEDGQWKVDLQESSKANMGNLAIPMPQ